MSYGDFYYGAQLVKGAKQKGVPPCNGCKDRYAGCHAGCDVYQQYKASLALPDWRPTHPNKRVPRSSSRLFNRGRKN